MLKKVSLLLLVSTLSCASGASMDAPSGPEICKKVLAAAKKEGANPLSCEFSDGTRCYPLKDGRIVCEGKRR